MLQMEDSSLKRRKVVRDHLLAADQHTASVNGLIRTRPVVLDVEGTALLQGLEARTRATKAAVHLVSRNPEDPDQKRRVPLERGERRHQGHEHVLRDILGFAGIT